jgi:hypothetical protein
VPQTPPKYCSSSTEAFLRITKLHLVDRGLRAFCSVIPGAVQSDAGKASESAAYQWAVDILCKALNSIAEVLLKDAGAVVQILNTYKDEKLRTRSGTYLDHSSLC